jgi:hypothetical protein
MNHIQDITLKCPQRINKFRNILKKIIVTKNQIENDDAHPWGLELSIFLNNTKAQTILNVKQMPNQTTQTTQQIIPNINCVTLHSKSHDKTWFRIRTTPNASIQNILTTLRDRDMPHNCTQLQSNIYEIEYTGNEKHNDIFIYNTMKSIFEKHTDVDEIIFYSNCKLITKIEASFSTILSNIFKFYYCYKRNTFDTIVTKCDWDLVTMLLIHCYVLAKQQNLNTNHSKMLQPLAILSAEKNIPSLNACKGETFFTGSPRDGILTGRGTQLGGNNKIELCCQLKHDLIQNLT